MKKIFITVPNKKHLYFKLSYGERSRSKRVKAVLAFKWGERKINLATSGGHKTAIITKNGQTVINESLSSANRKYLYWVLASFLEDWLPENFLLTKEKLYAGNEP